MLTGDKLETAESIGFSTRLLTPNMEIIRCSTKEHVELAFNKEKTDENYQLIADGVKISIIIEAKALDSILSDETFVNKRWFLKIAKTAETVICCRVSPSQKSQVVKLIREDDQEIVTLAIGDGANDVSMILEANIGVGLFGNEGMQAVDNSDFAIGEFRLLWHLLFKHGRWNYLRASDMVLYFFEKNIIFNLITVFFSLNNGFSGQNIFTEGFFTFYNLVFTCLPLMFKAAVDMDVYPID
jgi:phospholipid-transporting ATPase